MTNYEKLITKPQTPEEFKMLGACIQSLKKCYDKLDAELKASYELRHSISDEEVSLKAQGKSDGLYIALDEISDLMKVLNKTMFAEVAP